MSNTIHINSNFLCICGSNLPLSCCCLEIICSKDIGKNSHRQELFDLTKKYLTQFSVDPPPCAYPGCGKPSCDSHRISESSQLEEISYKRKKDNSLYVSCFLVNGSRQKYELQDKPITQALTIPLFCNDHDRDLFYPIDEMKEKPLHLSGSNLRHLSGLSSCIFRTLHAHKRVFEFEALMLLDPNYRRWKTLECALQYFHSKDERKKWVFEVLSNAESLISAINLHVKQESKIIQGKIASIENTLRNFSVSEHPERSRKFIFYPPKEGDLFVFSTKQKPPFMVSSILGVDSHSTSTVSTLKTSEEGWAFFLFFPRDNFFATEQALGMARNIDNIKAYSKNPGVDAARLLVDCLFLNSSCIAISREWIDTLKGRDLDYLKEIVNFTRNNNNPPTHPNGYFNPGFSIHSCRMVSIKEGRPTRSGIIF